MLFKCKICGGSLNVNSGEKLIECEYCGVKQTVSSFSEPQTQKIYNRANEYLMHNEFDKAENLYNQILFENKEDADAYWNILMCRYGVSYVKDPATAQYVPTCNRTLYTPIFNDENYTKAMQFADNAQKELYSSNAKTIDEIQKGILAVSKGEKAFDIFISYKETNANGARSQESIVAQNLYDKLTSEGYKVFFSRITLENKIGSEYEPYIYAALASSKVMITVSSSRENIESVWVKNEWSRFLTFAAKDSSKTIIPIYFNMDKKDLPEEFSHLATYDMQANGFEQELVRGIKKLIPTPVILQERRNKRNRILKRVGVISVICILIGGICAIPWLKKLPEYNEAIQLYYDKNYPEAAWAFNKLGSYRNSEELKEKAELSWRKSLATVIIEKWEEAGMSSVYYIDNNGSVQRQDAPNMNMQLRVGEHGKVVSLTPNNEVNVIYEDGFVSNVSEKISDKEKWNDIIQMSCLMSDDTTIALRADGTMIYDILNDNERLNRLDNSWMQPITEWKNIVSFAAEIGMTDFNAYDSAVIIGLQADGTMKCVTYNTSCDISKFKDIKYFNLYGLSIDAIDKHGKILSSHNGKFDEFEFENAVEVYTDYKDTHVLNSDGNIVDLSSNIVTMKDVVHVCGDYLISRNTKNMPVYTKWLERMR